MTDKITIDDVNTVTDDEAENASYFICMPETTPAVFHDDMIGTCTKCGQNVRYRPYGPKTPKKICMTCALTSGMLDADPDRRHVASDRAFDEAKSFHRKN